MTDSAPPAIYTLSLHDALPIYLLEGEDGRGAGRRRFADEVGERDGRDVLAERAVRGDVEGRSEEHTSELQSQSNLVCRLLLEKKKEKRAHCKFSNHSPQGRATP